LVPWLAGAPACLPFFRSRHWSQEATLPQLLDQLSKIEWVVYAKAPFGGANQVLEYLGRYTHRVALSNDRLLNVEGEQVTFQYKDYRSHDRQKSRSMTVTAEEFIRRFLLHAVPSGFQRISHYGLLASRNKKQTLALCRQLLGIECELLPTRAEMESYQAAGSGSGAAVSAVWNRSDDPHGTLPACRWPNRPTDTS
jgi:hypothetical protein